MAKKAAKKKKSATRRTRSLGEKTKSWAAGALVSPKQLKSSEIKGRVFVFPKTFKVRAIKDALYAWQLEWLRHTEKMVAQLDGKEGPIWVVQGQLGTRQDREHEGRLDSSDYELMREALGQVATRSEGYELAALQVEFFNCNDEHVRGAVVGLDMGFYNYTEPFKNAPKKLVLLRDDKALGPAAIRPAMQLSSAVNLGRHLVNMPANTLNPATYADSIKKLFASSSNVTVDVWTPERLRQQNMNLMLAVGEGAQYGPRLVHMSYRPQGSGSKPPVAFVGKGITFDSGGLDLKPSRGMRLMKKDMGGSAAVAALCHWCEQSGIEQPCDFYLALAENAVDKEAFRPGDVLHARSGKAVEIHNTDAEGRLVMADALDVALNKKGANAPKRVIDVATLTGAIKAGLGAEVGGLFSNDDRLAQKLQTAAQAAGDPVWRMPLYQKYRQQLSSSVADMANAADGFGGAITAALFLESFVGETPWAHLDIYAWKDSPEGALKDAGANGQAVQLLVYLLENGA